MFNVSNSAPFPAYYLLDIDPKSDASIVFHLPTNIWSEFPETLKTAPLISILVQTLNIPPFSFPKNNEIWGFGGSLVNGISIIPGFMKVTYELRRCTGSSGRISEQSQNRLFGAIASINLLIESACYIHSKSPANTSRLQQIEMIYWAFSEKKRRVLNFEGGLSHETCTWIESQPLGIHRDISGYMGNAYTVLMGASNVSNHETSQCYLEVKKGCSIALNVPGDRTGLGTYENRRTEHGIEFTTHNLDSPVQAIVLLVGLSALCRYARLAST